jgi:hypothetical protein
LAVRSLQDYHTKIGYLPGSSMPALAEEAG